MLKYASKAAKFTYDSVKAWDKFPRLITFTYKGKE